MQMPLLTFVLIVLMGLTACQNKQEADSSNPSGQNSLDEAQPNKNGVSGSGPLRLRGKAQGLEQPHLYENYLEWDVPNREPATFFIVKRSDWSAGRVVQGDQGFYQDNEIEEGKEYLYLVQMISGSKSTASDWIQIKVPRDKVIDGGEHIQSGKLTDYNRLFLKNRARISWLGETLEISAQEIISEDAVLESFSTNQKTASAGVVGKNGGNLVIRAQKLSGSLFVRGDGQNGGTGIEGAPGPTGDKGTTGPITFLHWGSPKTAPPDAYHIRGYWFYCDPPRPPGTVGGAGGVGFPGNTGGFGGNSTRVLVEIKDVSSGDVFFTNKPGIGGLGGPGGLGGEGGEGGWSGDIDWQTNSPSMPQGADLSLFHQCNAKQGAKGAQGSRGTEGAKGEDGFQAPFCLRLGNSQTGNCP